MKTALKFRTLRPYLTVIKRTQAAWSGYKATLRDQLQPHEEGFKRLASQTNFLQREPQAAVDVVELVWRLTLASAPFAFPEPGVHFGLLGFETLNGDPATGLTLLLYQRTTETLYAVCPVLSLDESACFCGLMGGLSYHPLRETLVALAKTPYEKNDR